MDISRLSFVEIQNYVKHLEEKIITLNTENTDLKRHNQLYRENILFYKEEYKKDIECLKSQIASLSMRLPLDIRV